jgi:5-methylcytosine-specific restriction endonuclease McrA
MNPISLKDASAAGLARYFTGVPCKHGHVAERRVCDRGCTGCDNAKRARHYRADREAYLSKQRLRQTENREGIRAASRAWKARNTARVKDYMLAYRETNREALAEADAARRAADPDKYRSIHRQWVRDNPGAKNAHTAGRLAHIKRATPKWLTPEDRQAIIHIYETAARISSETHIPHQVDHIVPLRGVTASGLHVPGNLRVITAAENARKKNKVLPELIEGTTHG